MKKLKSLFSAIIIIMLSITIVGAAPSKPAASTPAAKIKTAAVKKTAVAKPAVKSIFPLKVTDFYGRTVIIKKAPKRIISLAPSTTELLYRLGLGKNIVGVTDYDNYPNEVKKVAKVGGFKGPNAEAILKQKPDIIFASSLSGKSEMEAIQKLKIPVLILEAKKISQIYDSIKMIAKITGTDKKGSEIISSMKTDIKNINDKVKGKNKPKVFYLVDLNGNWTAGKGTFIDEIITLAGGENIADDVNGWTQYSKETLIAKNPDIIIASSYAGKLDAIKAADGFKGTDAVKNNKVYIISNDDIISRSSDRIILGLKEIAKYLHAEAFK